MREQRRTHDPERARSPKQHPCLPAPRLIQCASSRLAVGFSVRAIIHLSPTTSDGAVVPIHYNAVVQAMIYSSWNPLMAAFIHERGFPLESRSFRLFVFSRLSGPYQRQGAFLRYHGPIALQFASPIQALVEDLTSAWLRQGIVRLGSSRLSVDSIDLKPAPSIAGDVLVRTLSPVTVYETLHAPDGRAKTYYYAPTEREFGTLCGVNARRKLAAFRGRGEATGDLSVSPADGRPHRQVIISYKGTVVKGWTGAFRLSGPPDLIQMVLDAGLGAKNSQGFGMVEIWEGGR